MVVAVIGGLSRATRDWQRAGDALGIVVEHHDGGTVGRHAQTLAAVARRADVVVAMTAPNSHGAVAIADALALARTMELAR